MTNPNLTRVLREAVAEERKYKLCLIEDIIKVKKTLFGFGYKQHDEFTDAAKAGELFNTLYELDIPALEVVMNSYTKQVNEHVIEKIKF